MAQVNIQTRNFEVDGDLRTHVGEKIDSLERLWQRGGEAHVRMEAERGRYMAEITLISGGMVTRGQERASNARLAFDNAVDKLQAQLQRYKQKAQARSRRHDNRDDVGGTVHNPTLSLPTSGAENGGGEANGYNGQPVRVKRFALKPMSPEEAALQMDLLGHSFFVFRDAENNQVSVVYRRDDGGFGLIEPVAD